MPFCIRCAPFDCGNSEGLISLEWSTRANLTYINDDCSRSSSTSVGVTLPGAGTGGGDSGNYVEGPVLGSVSLSAYGFIKGVDRWLGSRCMAQVQGSQSITQKYDLATEQYYLIPNKSNTGQITGDIDENLVSLGVIRCSTTSYRANLVNGATVAMEMGTDLGGELNYNAYPISFSFPLMDQAFRIFDQKAFLTGFNLNVNFPEPAIVNYSFQFILDCGDSTGPGSKKSGAVKTPSVNPT